VSRSTFPIRRSSCGRARIPASALILQDVKHAVYVVSNGKARRTLIEIGRQDGKEIEVRSGLKPSDRVVIGANKVLTGDVVPVEIKKDPEDK
jgi:multidrug efflux pump subunit AcrA (membrane-fusion protein)